MKKPDLIKLKKALDELDEYLKPVYERINDFQAMSYRTPDEEKELQKLLQLAANAVPVYAAAADFFGNEAYNMAVAYYNGVKQHAENGNVKAKEILKELAPLYEQALLSQIDPN